MIVAKSFFLVRAVVTEPLRDKFDRWYSTDHLPWAIQVFKCEKVWRFWSEVEQGVHCRLPVRGQGRARCRARLAGI
jgi:hypothetical protein